MSILAITANAAKAGAKKVQTTIPKWSKTEARHVKVNVDASFFSDSCT
jgi:hypothetical protein